MPLDAGIKPGGARRETSGSSIAGRRVGCAVVIDRDWLIAVLRPAIHGNRIVTEGSQGVGQQSKLSTQDCLIAIAPNAAGIVTGRKAPGDVVDPKWRWIGRGGKPP